LLQGRDVFMSGNRATKPEDVINFMASHSLLTDCVELNALHTTIRFLTVLDSCETTQYELFDNGCQLVFREAKRKPSFALAGARDGSGSTGHGLRVFVELGRILNPENGAPALEPVTDEELVKLPLIAARRPTENGAPALMPVTDKELVELPLISEKLPTELVDAARRPTVYLWHESGEQHVAFVLRLSARSKSS